MFSKQLRTFGFNLDYSKITSPNFLEYVHQFKKLEDKMPPFVVYNGLPIIFDPTWTDIGLTMSGGADSSMLFYMLCDIITQMNPSMKLHPITLVRYWDERPWLTVSSKNVYAYMKERYPNIIQERCIGFVPHALESTPIKDLTLPRHQVDQYAHYPDSVHADVYAVSQFVNYLIDNHKFNAMFSGVTTNPEHIVPGATPGQRPPPGRELRTLTDDVIIRLASKMKSGQQLSYQASDPFQYISKNWVMAQYSNLGLDDLLNITRSCQEVISGFNTVDVVPDACGTCYFCQERAWGIENGEQFLKESNQ